MFKSFLDSNNLTNLFKTNSCFNGKGLSINLILTKRKYSFKYTSSYETVGHFNMEPNNPMFKSFLDSNNLTNLFKTNSCFNGKGLSINLILTKRKYSFKYTSSYETGPSDHHHMVYAMLKSSFINIEPKLLNYGDYKNFSFGNFKEDLSAALLICRNSYDEFKSAFITALDKHASKKKKWLRGNK